MRARFPARMSEMPAACVCACTRVTFSQSGDTKPCQKRIDEHAEGWMGISVVSLVVGEGGGMVMVSANGGDGRVNEDEMCVLACKIQLASEQTHSIYVCVMLF